MLSRIVDLVLPPRCGSCRAVGTWLCRRCSESIRRLEEPTCRRCGAEVDSVRRDCGCRNRLKALSRLRSAVAYEGPIELAIKRFKYEGWRRLAGPLAVLVAERLTVEGLSGAWMLPVPLHRLNLALLLTSNQAQRNRQARHSCPEFCHKPTPCRAQLPRLPDLTLCIALIALDLGGAPYCAPLV